MKTRLDVEIQIDVDGILVMPEAVQEAIKLQAAAAVSRFFNPEGRISRTRMTVRTIKERDEKVIPNYVVQNPNGTLGVPV